MPLPLVKSESSPSRTIAIAAGKGGVGKSTITVQLAHALKRLGYAVGVLDADVYGPSIRKMLPEDQMPRQTGELIEPALCSGIKMISVAYFNKEQEGAAVRAPIANSLIQRFLNGVNWGPLDFLLIDFPPGTGDIQITLSQKAQLTGAIMVTTPQEVALMDVKKAMHLFEIVNIPILGILENMAGFYSQEGEPIPIFGKGGGGRLAAEKGVPLLGEIPLDPSLCACSDLGKSLFIEQAESRTCQALTQLGKNVAAYCGQENDGPLEIHTIAQKDNYTFSIVWNNGREQAYRLSDLQKECPCANCRENNRALPLNSEVMADAIRMVGRYALAIDYTSGCSKGIYSLDWLYRKGEKK
ncbi:MAG: P-loop NTPase [Parachlamydia sp.]|jgi:ATP-binding protein involved in chromosome partitioning|nr:P-loop NTPase [Parachlamydia sp.]